MGTQMYTNTDDQRVEALDSRIMSRGQSWGDQLTIRLVITSVMRLIIGTIMRSFMSFRNWSLVCRPTTPA